MNRQLPADEVADHELPPTNGRFSHLLRDLKGRNGPVSPVAYHPADEKDNDQARRLIAAAQLNQVYRSLVSRKVRATTRLLALALALFLFAVLSPTPQPWAFIALGAVLACAVGHARQAGSLGLNRRRQVRAVLDNVRTAASAAS